MFCNPITRFGGYGPRTAAAVGNLPVTTSLLWQLEASNVVGASHGQTFSTWLMSSGSVAGMEGMQFKTRTDLWGSPTYYTSSINGYPSVGFPAQDALITTRNTFDFTSQSHCFFVLRGIGLAGLWNYGPESVIGGDANYEFYPNNTANNTVYMGFAQKSRTINGATAPIVITASWHIYNAVASRSYWEERQNNLYIGSGSTGDASYIPSESQVVFGRSKVNAAMGDWRCAEHIMYNTRLSDSDRTLVMNYLATKYGITL